MIVEVGWPALVAQLGSGYGEIRFFRRHFIECLAMATAAYPEARVDLGERGVILRPSAGHRQNLVGPVDLGHGRTSGPRARAYLSVRPE